MIFLWEWPKIVLVYIVETKWHNIRDATEIVLSTRKALDKLQDQLSLLLLLLFCLISFESFFYMSKFCVHVGALRIWWQVKSTNTFVWSQRVHEGGSRFLTSLLWQPSEPPQPHMQLGLLVASGERTLEHLQCAHFFFFFQGIVSMCLKVKIKSKLPTSSNICCSSLKTWWIWCSWKHGLVWNAKWHMSSSFTLALHIHGPNKSSTEEKQAIKQKR